MCKHTTIIAKVFLALLFLMSGIGKITNFSQTATGMEAVGVPLPKISLVIAIILELGGVALLLTKKHAKIGAWMLILFTVLASLFYHLDFTDKMQTIALLKNLAVIGGLLLVTKVSCCKKNSTCCNTKNNTYCKEDNKKCCK
ncbi:MAG: DoxX family protein [Candidatus Moranbacteria bacterium]|nr:DoxX family protein [Candidatus Moranbacteria bacterium]